MPDTTITVLPALAKEGDAVNAIEEIVNDLKLDLPTAQKLAAMIKSGDRLTLITQLPTVAKEVAQLEKDVMPLVTQLKSSWKSGEFWFALAAVASPEVEKLVNTTLTPAEHIAVIVLAGVIYVTRQYAKVKHLA